MMKRRVSKRRLMHVIMYAAAIFSVATVPWSLLAWKHVLVVWGADFDWVPRLLFVFLAMCTVGLMFLSHRYIEENGLYLYRHEAAWINLAGIVALPTVAIGANYVSVHSLSVTFMAYALHGLLALVLELYCFYQMVNLYDRPVRPRPEAKHATPSNPFLIFSLVVLLPAIWVSATYAGAYFKVGQVHPALPYITSTLLTLVIAGILRAIFAEPAIVSKKSKTPIPLSPTPPPSRVTPATPPGFSPKIEVRSPVNN